MKLVFLTLIVTSAVMTAPTNDDSQAKVLDFENRNDGSGNYFFRYETSNWLTREEKGTLVNAGQADEHVEVHGSYSYVDSDGVLQTVSYTADQNGYRVDTVPPLNVPGTMFSLPGSAVASLLGR